MVCYLFFFVFPYHGAPGAPEPGFQDTGNRSFSSTAGLKEFDVPVPELQPTNTPEYSVKVVGWEWIEWTAHAPQKMHEGQNDQTGDVWPRCGKMWDIYIYTYIHILYIIFIYLFIYLFIYQQGRPKKKTSP